MIAEKRGEWGKERRG